GSGKSTIGKALAEKLGKEFIDTDELIIKNEKKAISTLFAEKGEAYFRLAETEAIKEASAKSGCVIATGGGAVLKKENVDFLRSNGKIFFLNRPIEDILPTDDRPLSRNRTDLQKRFDERYPIYQETADEEIFVDGKVENAVRRIEETL
ncbi:MAG: shikimate kinase, partial [Oscillospiraceae bacterium]|nr:shikimate kinase [Oscillospiraceae bacterium]